MTPSDLSNFIWQIADLLRGPYRPPQYERVMLPMTVLRRFDCVLAPTKAKVLREFERRKEKYNGTALDSVLNRAAGQRFHSHSPLTFEKLKADPDNINAHFVNYIHGFSANVRRIFDYFDFEAEIERMHEANVLYLIVSRFCDVDLHPDSVPNVQMGIVFEDLIRRFNEAANETAGDYFTPREVIRLMVSLLFLDDDDLLSRPGTVRKLLDPACGTGGMLAESQKYMREHNLAANLHVYGQDYNKRAYAIAASDMLIKQVDHNGTGDNIRFGDSLRNDPKEGDQFAGEKFDYLLANPPFGVDWKRQQREIEDERRRLGFAGRFGAGLPRVNDGALLFLQHMISKFEPVNPAERKHGSRLGIVFNGSPLFTGGAGSGESDIRKWIIENDWLEAIVALPEQMFYNTGIGTYVWIVTNRKEKRRKGRIQLVDARDFFVPMRRSLGDKRRKIGEGPDVGEPPQIDEILRAYGAFEETQAAFVHDKRGTVIGWFALLPGVKAPAPASEQTVEVRTVSRLFDNEDFGYRRVTIERPLRLKFQIDVDRKSRFLDAVPHLLDGVQAIDRTLGRQSISDWNRVSEQIDAVLKEQGSKWKAAERKIFRDVFTDTDPGAEPVVAKTRKTAREKHARLYGWFPQCGGKTQVAYEPDAKLRDFENIPLKDNEAEYFDREVLPHVSDAWIDPEKTKIGYEINFNRHFYVHQSLRPLAAIDTDLRKAEEEILRLLKEVVA